MRWLVDYTLGLGIVVYHTVLIALGRDALTDGAGRERNEHGLVR